MSSLPPTDPATPENFSRRVKKALLLGLATGGAFFLVLIPTLVNASFLSDLLGKTASASVAAVSSFNSQTVPLLAAAKNIDPNPPVGGGDITLVGGEALEATENPFGDADTVSHQVNSQISVYTVRDGDSLSSIADMFGVTQNTIIGANDIKKGVIHPGDELIILPITGLQHVVLKGETTESLALKYKSDAGDIASYNNLADGEPLTVGQSIIIPNGELAVVNTTTTSTKITSTKSKTSTIKSSTFKAAPLRDAGGPEYNGYYGWPVAGGIITQSLHGYNGVDIGAPTGTDIYSAAAGTVIIAKSGGWNGGYGNYIVVAHDNGTQTLYAHASRVLVAAGDSVSQGELIGKIGRTGEATGPHLHFEVRGATNPFGAIPVGSGD